MAEKASMCRKRGEHGTFKERKEVHYNHVHNMKGIVTRKTVSPIQRRSSGYIKEFEFFPKGNW